jgi:recombination protein RecA
VSSVAVALLRQRLAEITAPSAPTTRGLPTGIPGLDALLSSGGLPRGRLTELLGPRGSGTTSVLRDLVAETLARGEWVAYVDAGRTLAARDWIGTRHSGLGTRHRGSRVPSPECRVPADGLWMVRPRNVSSGAWCTDVLLRSGAFGLVILDGAPPLSRSVAARLVRLARESDAALVVTGEDAMRAAALPAALLLRVERPRRSRRAPPLGAAKTRPVVITVERGGRRGSVEVSYDVRVASRVCTHSEVADRRGVERAGTERAERSGPEPSMHVPAAPHRDLGKRRRCAEPDYERPAAERKRRALAGVGGVAASGMG